MIRRNYKNVIVRIEDDKLLETYGLKCKDEISKRFYIVGFIGEKSEHGKGYGIDSLKLINMRLKYLMQNL